jgi:hypothetical protein
MTDRLVIDIGPGSARPKAVETLLRTIEWLLPVRFVDGLSEQTSIAGQVFWGKEDGRVIRGVPVFSVPVPILPVDRNLEAVRIEFSDSQEVPWPFGGKSLINCVPNPIRCLAAPQGGEILAVADRGPVWTVCEYKGVKYSMSAFPLPHLTDKSMFADFFNGARFMEVLPLLAWLRALPGMPDQRRPLRACFVIDDPNLHWPSYGYVDYNAIRQRAERENFHVTFATIPLDAFYTHKAAADIFRTAPQRLSLCVHGNNHTRQELAKPYSAGERSALLRQALARISRMERSSGLSVSRVMIPPHGACSEEMFSALREHGFEGACVSHGSVQAHNPNKNWTANLGYLPFERVAGCPVLPRWSLGGDKTNTILLAAYLGQAVILRGHHEDVKEGLEVFSEPARVINSLGQVIWSNLSDVVRVTQNWTPSHVCWVRPRDNPASFEVPLGAMSVGVPREGECTNERWQVTTPDGLSQIIWTGDSLYIPHSSDRKVILHRLSDDENTAAIDSRTAAVAAVVRRALTEGRDRILPLSKFLKAETA